MNLDKILDIESKELFTKKNAVEFLKLAEKEIDNSKISKEIWYKFLDVTRHSEFLKALGNDKNRIRWSEIVFKIIQKTEYGLLQMFEQRVESHPDKVLFQTASQSKPEKWTYKQTQLHLKEIAAFFYKLKKDKARVAIFLRNSIEGASVDLACLMYDIFDTPLNIHFSSEILEHIFEILDIDIVVTDTAERLKVVKNATKNLKKTIKIVVTENNSLKTSKNIYHLGKECKNISINEAEKILQKRDIKPIKQVTTTMFTSGSTGMPKGVSFSIYNIVSKRFARTAALPETGNESFICYLPLFHTFGRYLELTGTIFWSGTYTFAGNPSAATLLALFPKINPTGFISVPVRWVQIYDKCMKLIGDEQNEDVKKKIIRSVIGKNLHWGLSAAGFLDPKIFRFFHKYGVSLNSGFGMTEATGGITMTPPFDYIEKSTGIPLPGMETRLNELNELELKGHYLAKYLEDAGVEDEIPYPHEEDYWLKTGDIFRIDKDGFHEIIDRVKDIYKNNKGQTVAPGVTEKKFTGVPGIKRTFLVGDGRPYNVLLIVPDCTDPVLLSLTDEQNKDEYFHQIVTTANKDLAPYERVINFTLIDRDFSEDEGELTAKGSYKRKAIEKNFLEIIKKLYVKNHVYIKNEDYEIIIPRWFFRDIGVLETDIEKTETGLHNKVTKKTLRIIKCEKEHTFCVGDLTYTIANDKIDLGRIVRQPKLWVANPELIAFSPCKESFDLPLKEISLNLCIPQDHKIYSPANLPQPKGINDSDLIFINSLLSTALHSEESIALMSLQQIELLFSNYEKNKVELIRRRLEALACHQSEELRMLAYAILLSKDPDPDFSKILPTFINSGKPFLNEKSIKKIASSNFDIVHLEAFRKRMYAYRTGLQWPANEQTRKQFDTIFKLLLNFGKNNPKYYKPLRAEFATWMIMKKEPYLAKRAKKYFTELFKNFEKFIYDTTEFISEDDFTEKFIFDDGISELDQEEILTKLTNSHFLKQSIIMAYDEHDFNIKNVRKQGIWVSRVRSYRATKHFRMSLTMENGKHFDLHTSLDKNINSLAGLELIYQNISLSGFPYENPAIAQFGCTSLKDHIVSSRYVSQLSAWEKIRAYAEVQTTGFIENPNTWRKLYIRSMSAFFKSWSNLNKDIMPGFVSPNNVVVQETDFSNNAKIISLSGWQRINEISPLFLAMLQNFYYKTVAHYPVVKKYIKKSWLFHSCVETFGKKEATKIMNRLKTELDSMPELSILEKELLAETEKYLKSFKGQKYLPLALFNAIDKFFDWKNKNPLARSKAKEQTISELFELYNLGKYPEIVRYKFYRETYFFDAKENVIKAFDKLLTKMAGKDFTLAVQLVELSDLQTILSNETDKVIFGKMVFPDIRNEQKVDILKKGEKTDEHVVLYSKLKDKKGVEYSIREPLEASEVGALYKLFYKENYPKKISKMDKHYVVIDANEQVIAGLCYKLLDDGIVLIDGMAVTTPLHGRGLGSALMSDFFTRMKAQGLKLIKAHFLFGNYYLKHNFKIDNKWGALVREL